MSLGGEAEEIEMTGAWGIDITAITRDSDLPRVVGVISTVSRPVRLRLTRHQLAQLNLLQPCRCEAVHNLFVVGLGEGLQYGNLSRMFPNVRCLDISDNEITTSMLRDLAKHPLIWLYSFDKCNINDLDVTLLGDNDTISHLEFRKSRLRFTNSAPIINLRSLRFITLTECEYDDTLITLFSAAPDLEGVRITNSIGPPIDTSRYAHSLAPQFDFGKTELEPRESDTEARP